MQRVISLFILAILSLLSAQALADQVTPDSPMPYVLDLTTIPEHVDTPYFVEFYSPQCSWCKKVAPIVRIFGGLMRESKVKVAKINCVTHVKECEKAGVQGYPTFKGYFPPKEGQKDTRVIDFQGPRSLETFLQFLQKELTSDEIGNIVNWDHELSSVDELQEIIKKPKSFKMVAYTAEWCGHCKKLIPTWRALALELLGGDFPIKIVRIDADKHRDDLRKAGITISGYPTILFYDQDGKDERFQGPRTLIGLIDYLRERTQLDIPDPAEEVGTAPDNGKMDSAFLAARYYENLAKFALDNRKILKELQLQLDEGLEMLRSLAHSELPEETQKRLEASQKKREEERKKVNAEL